MSLDGLWRNSLLNMQRCAVTSCLLVAALCDVSRSDDAVALEHQIAEAVNELIQAADVYDAQRMQRLVRRIARWEQPAIPAVVRHWNHENANVRWQMVRVTQQMQLADDRLFQPLLVAAVDADADVRGAAVLALAELFPDRSETAGAMRTLTRDPQSLVRVQAYDAAWKIGKRQGVISALVQLLQHQDWMTAQEAANSLAKIGPPVVEDLQPLLQTPQPMTQVLAWRTLARIKPLPEKVLRLAEGQATSADAMTRRAAIALLAMADLHRWQVLHKLSRHPDPAIRRDLAQAIVKFQDGPEKVDQLLVGLLDDHDPYVVVAALHSLKKRPRCDIPVSKMRQLLRHDHADIRAAMVAAVSQLQPLPDALRSELISLTEYESVDYIRRHAHRLLRRE